MVSAWFDFQFLLFPNTSFMIMKSTYLHQRQTPQSSSILQPSQTPQRTLLRPLTTAHFSVGFFLTPIFLIIFTTFVLVSPLFVRTFFTTLITLFTTLSVCSSGDFSISFLISERGLLLSSSSLELGISLSFLITWSLEAAAFFPLVFLFFTTTGPL